MATMVEFLAPLAVIWGVVTAIFLVLVAYRAVLSSREEDQVFLDEAEVHLAREQAALARRVIRLGPYVIALGIASALLFVIVASLWVYRGWTAAP